MTHKLILKVKTFQLSGGKRFFFAQWRKTSRGWKITPIPFRVNVSPPKKCCILGSLQDGEILGSIFYENPNILRLLDSKNSTVWMVRSQFAHDPYLGVKFWVNTCGIERSDIFIAGGQHGGLTSRWERR